MSKSVLSTDGSVTYYGQTFRKGDEGRTIACHDRSALPPPTPGMLFTIEEIDHEDDTLYVNFRDTLTAWIPMAAASMSPADPWAMPALKPWMRALCGGYFYVVVDVEGELFGCRTIGTRKVLTHQQMLDETTKVHAAPSMPTLLIPEILGDQIWDRAEAMQAAEKAASGDRRKHLQDEISRLSAELAALS